MIVKRLREKLEDFIDYKSYFRPSGGDILESSKSGTLEGRIKEIVNLMF